MEEDRLILEELNARAAPLRVAVVTETYPPEVNGVAMTIGRMVGGLVAAGHTVQLIRPRQSQDRQELHTEAPGIEQVLSRGVPLPRYASLQLGLPARQALVRHWSHRRPDVVQVVTEGPLGWSAIAAARKLKLPVVSEFHTNFHSYSRHYGIGWLKRPIAAYLRKFHNGADLTLVPTQRLRRELAGFGYRRVEVVARGVDTALFDPQRRSEALRRDWGLSPDGLAVLYVGRIAPEKNLDLLEKSYAAIRARHRQARMVLVGDGPARRDLEAKHPDWVFCGTRRGEDLARHYASGDLFLFPSLTETFGNVTTEALASGLPVVAYDDAAAAELLRHGEDAWLAAPGDEAAFIGGALALAGDASYRAALAAAARQRVRVLDWSVIVERLVEVFREVVNDPHGRQHAAPLLAVASD